MKYSIVFSKDNGNTKLLSETVKEILVRSHQEVAYFGLPDQEAFSSEVILVGFWTDKGRCDEVAASFLKEIKKKKIFLFGSCGFGKSEAYFNEVLNRSLEFVDSSNQVIGSFICQGKMPHKVRERYESMLMTGLDTRKYQMLIENFDEASLHPNVEDLKNLEKTLSPLLEEIK